MSTGPILIFAPHPDDESLACAGVMARAGASEPDGIRVVIFTEGEAHLQACAYYCCLEAAQQVAEKDLRIGAVRFLGRQAGKPRAWLAAYVADWQGRPLPDAQVSADDRRAETNDRGYALLEIPVSALRPSLMVTANNVKRDMLVNRTLNSADRRHFGLQRRQESQRALALLGLPEQAVSFWECPDQGLDAILSGQSRPGGPDRPTLETRIRELLDSIQPAVVYLPQGGDADSDHRAVHDLVIAALGISDGILVLSYIIHPRGSHDDWPLPSYRAPDRWSRYQPDMPMHPPPGLPQPELRLPLDGPLGPAEKGKLLELYETQMAADDNGFLLAFAKRDEIFWRERVG